MATFDGLTVIAVGLDNIVLVSTDGGGSHIFQLIDTVVCYFGDVFLMLASDDGVLEPFHYAPSLWQDSAGGTVKYWDQ